MLSKIKEIFKVNKKSYILYYVLIVCKYKI